MVAGGGRSLRKKGDAGSASSADRFDWGLYPDLERFVSSTVSSFLSGHKFAKTLSEKMLSQTSTKFVDWIDHVILPESEIESATLERLGLQQMHTGGDLAGAKAYRHMRSYLFPILVSDKRQREIVLKPESVDAFLQVLGTGAEVEGRPFSPLRKAVVSVDGAFVLSAVERRGYDGFVAKEPDDIERYLEVLSSFFHRQRYFKTDEEGVKGTEALVGESLDGLDGARASDAFFRAERAYWQRRNRAGQVQKARQDTLGLGWGNHDHHTYRCSRDNFAGMIRIFEKMGYECREKYYAGERAGWGAQIL